MKRIINAGTRVNRDRIKIDLMDYLLTTMEGDIDGEPVRFVYDRIVDAARQG